MQLEPLPVEVVTGENARADYFREVLAPRHKPVVLRGLDIGPCTSLWQSTDYVKANSEDKDVRIHVTSDPLRMDFKSKNFTYQTTSFHDLIDKAAAASDSGGGMSYYLRSTSIQDSRSPVLFEQDFPRLSQDFRLGDIGLFDRHRMFSSVFRASSAGVRVWTHYDVMDNFYVQACCFPSYTYLCSMHCLKTYFTKQHFYFL